jgi:hypothetical protein
VSILDLLLYADFQHCSGIREDLLLDLACSKELGPAGCCSWPIATSPVYAERPAAVPASVPQQEFGIVTIACEEITRFLKVEGGEIINRKQVS